LGATGGGYCTFRWMSKRDRPSFLLASFGQWASKFASETKFSGQLKASVRAEVTSVTGDSVFALFPCHCLRGESLQLYLQKTNVRVDLWQCQYMHCRAWIKSFVPEEPDSGVMVTWTSLKFPDNQSTLPTPTRFRGKVDDSKSHYGVVSLSG